MRRSHSIIRAGRRTGPHNGARKGAGVHLRLRGPGRGSTLRRLRRIAATLALLVASLLGALPGGSRAFAASPGKNFHVVIDPGHGGADFGTIFDDGRARVTEKSITLLLARQVADELIKHHITATLTRDDDREVPLGHRTALANKLKADVFLSIHMNSTPNAGNAATGGENPQGIETFILNNTTDASSKRLAQLENTVLGPRDLRGESPEQADVALILHDLTLDANTAESKRLACAIQDRLVSGSGQGSLLLGKFIRRNRGVKQALFHVLLGAEMPSVLVEAGFLSHPKDRALVLSPEGRKQISSSIADAIAQFKRFKGTPQALSALSRCKVH